jgi:hypothetical protein
MTRVESYLMRDLIRERKEALEARYKELYSMGTKANDVLSMLSEESGISKKHLYRLIEVKKCKFEINKMGRLR